MLSWFKTVILLSDVLCEALNQEQHLNIDLKLGVFGGVYHVGGVFLCFFKLSINTMFHFFFF